MTSGERWSFEGVGLPGGEDVAWGITDAILTASPTPGAERLPGRFVLPGLVDAHRHLTLRVGDGGPVGQGRDAMLADLDAARNQGVLAVRDTGAVDGLTLSLAEDADADRRPVVLPAGRFLAPDRQYFPGLYEPVPPEGLVDAALAELRAGTRWVKLVGDFPVDLTPPAVPTYDDDLVRALCDAVHAAGGRVAAHTQTECVADLVDAGIDSVEHGDALDESTLERMATRGIAWTPTLSAGAGRSIDEIPERARERVAGVRDRFRVLLPLARRLGVTVLAGTDGSGPLHGEVARLAGFGLSPVDALGAATTSARDYLGLPALTPGSPADLVTFEDDPRDDPTVLGRPAAVVLRGRRVA